MILLFLLTCSAAFSLCGLILMIRGMKEEQATRRQRTPGLTHLDPP